MDKKLFVVGAPRSGTSYLARALSLADDVAYFEESGAFDPFGSRQFAGFFNEVLRKEQVYRFRPLEHKLLRVTDRLRGLDRLDDLVHRMLLHTKLDFHDLSPSGMLIDVQQCRLSDRDMTLQNELVRKYQSIKREKGATVLFPMLFDDFVRLSGKTHLVEKTPDHISYVPVIRYVFPEAKIIVIRRDKKDAIASYIKHFDARTSLRNRFLTDKMLLKKQCRILRYYDQLEQWMVDQSWCYSIDYVQLIEHPLETVCSALNWAGLSVNTQKHGSLFVSGTVSSHWNRLSGSEQRLVTALFG